MDGAGTDACWKHPAFEGWLLRATSRHSSPFFVPDASWNSLVVSPHFRWFLPTGPLDSLTRSRLRSSGIEQTELCGAVWSALRGNKPLDEALMDAGLFDALERFATRPAPRASCAASEKLVITPAVDEDGRGAEGSIVDTLSVPTLEAANVGKVAAVEATPGGLVQTSPKPSQREPVRVPVAKRLADLDRQRVLQRSKRIVQVTGVLGPLTGTPDDHMREARTTILNWVAERGVAVPVKGFNGEPFDRDLTQTRNPIVVEATSDCWAMQFDTMPGTAGETVWRTEVVLLKTRERVQLGLGLTAIDSKGTEGIRHTSIPNVIRRLATSIGLFDDGRLLEANPITSETVGDIDRLIELIESPKRTRAVVAIAVDGAGRRLISPAHLAGRLAGVAHVVDLDTEASWELSARYGKTLSAFGLAVRIYRPSFDPDVDSPTRHPLFVGERWLERSAFLQGRVLEICAEETTGGGHDAVPTFTAVRRYIAEQRLQEATRAASTRQEQTVLMAQENERLRSECAVSDELLTDAVAEREEALAVCEQHKEVARRWQVRAEWLEGRIRELIAARGEDGQGEEALPETWDDIGEWAEQNLGGRVSILPPALKAAKKSVFTDIPLVYAALKMLGERYQPMRAARTEAARHEYTTELARLRLDVSEVGAAAMNHRTEANYKAKWMGRTITLDMHVSGSSSRRQDKGFRLYFYYDVENDIVVVGHFPTHLPNSLT